VTALQVISNYLDTHPDNPTACWPYPGGYSNGKGYRILFERDADGVRRTRSAHRLAWEAANGPIPDGAQIDHECHNDDPTCDAGPTCPHRACVNPHHLAAKTGRANTLDGRTPAAANAVKTECDSGHPFTGDNVIPNSGGGRDCRECKRARQRRYDRARRAANVAAYGRTRGPK
jgi:hypothetical protein